MSRNWASSSFRRAGHVLHRFDLGRAADPGDRHADVDGRPLIGVEQVGLQEDLAVGDRDDVGRDVGRHVVGLGLDDRQSGHRAGAEVVGQLGAAFQQPAVQVEDVTRVRLPARRPAQQQRHRTVGLGLLGQVVEDDQHVFALVHPVLADGRAGVGSDVLVSGRIRGRRVDDRGVRQSPGRLELAADGGDRRGLLADRDIDAAHLLFLVAGFPGRLLVHDRVDGDGGLAGLAVADDQLSLTPTDRNHRVDGLDPRLQGLPDLLAVHHPGGLQLQRTPLVDVGEVAETVDRVAQRVDGPAEVAVAHRHGEDVPGPLHDLTFLDASGVTHHDDADLADVEVQGDAQRAVLELQQLVRHR